MFFSSHSIMAPIMEWPNDRGPNNTSVLDGYKSQSWNKFYTYKTKKLK